MSNTEAATLRYTLYVWKEETFRAWKLNPIGDNGPASFEMYDTDPLEVRVQIADHVGCEVEEVHLTDASDGASGGDESYIEVAFGLRFWDFVYPEGIGSYLVVLNTLEG